jgi:uncharacterized glyoxalase superfamily protein PhnB
VTPSTKQPRVTSFAPQFLVDDLARSIAFYARCVANGVTVSRPLAPTAWGTQDFYVEDPDGYIIAFGGRSDGDG